MCGLAFGKGKDMAEIFKNQSSRGIDGVGILYPSGTIFTSHVSDEHPVTKVKLITSTIVDRYCEAINKSVKKNSSSDLPVLMHHRKASIGVKTIDNVHPFKGERYVLAQNGTDKQLRFWGTLAFIPEHYTDSYCLLKYIEHTCNKIEFVPAMLDFLVDNNVTIGVVWIVDLETNTGLVYSDGARSLYVNEIDGKIEFSSLEGTDEYDTEGYALFKLDGTILESNWSVKNLKKVVTPTYPISQHRTYPSYTPAATTQSTVMTNIMLFDVFDRAVDGDEFEVTFMNQNMYITTQSSPARCYKYGNVIFGDSESFNAIYPEGWFEIKDFNMSRIKFAKKLKAPPVPTLFDDDYYSNLI